MSHLLERNRETMMGTVTKNGAKYWRTKSVNAMNTMYNAPALPLIRNNVKKKGWERVGVKSVAWETDLGVE